ncbi:hypothetical protein ACQEUU_29235 [Nonomuraea sp. CA-218870]|uniref:hypothetical protein n=1 Tax=Nonomuraea sp. CA-218870 TaxID=3239998 RepID=UPI003D905C0D
MVRVPGKPGLWVIVAVAQLPVAYYLPGRVSWPMVPLIALAAMIAAVTRAYQDAAQYRAEEPVVDADDGPRAV